MNSTLKTFGILLLATLFINGMFLYMTNNIEEFESVALPPKKMDRYKTDNPILKINAQSREAWTLVDFSSGKTHQVRDPEKEKKRLQSVDWDLGFQRTKIITNGGETNPKGAVWVKSVGEVAFDSIDRFPESQEGFYQDHRKWGAVTNKALVDWYVYRTRTHNVESKKHTYLVRTGDGYLKLKIVNYYCGRPESDCKSMMCGRDEAACFNIEYLYSPHDEMSFANASQTTPQTTQVTH